MSEDETVGLIDFGDTLYVVFGGQRWKTEDNGATWTYLGRADEESEG